MLTVQALKFTRIFKEAVGLRITVGNELSFLRSAVRGVAQCDIADMHIFQEAQEEYLKALKEGRLEVI